jgi:hypothetical protein
VKVAVMAFFVLAAVGMICGVDVFVCAQRALIGAAATFVAAVLVSRLINWITVETIVSGMQRKGKTGEANSEPRK